MRHAALELRAQNQRALAILPVSTNMVMFAISMSGDLRSAQGAHQVDGPTILGMRNNPINVN